MWKVSNRESVHVPKYVVPVFCFKEARKQKSCTQKINKIIHLWRELIRQNKKYQMKVIVVSSFRFCVAQLHESISGENPPPPPTLHFQPTANSA